MIFDIFSDKVCILINEERIKFFNNIWKPQPYYKFPKISYLNLIRSFQMKWLEKYKWLAYFDENLGLFCKYCTIILNLLNLEHTKWLGL